MKHGDILECADYSDNKKGRSIRIRIETGSASTDHDNNMYKKGRSIRIRIETYKWFNHQLWSTNIKKEDPLE